jgi:polyisoprenoid-binding protein YceI
METGGMELGGMELGGTKTGGTEFGGTEFGGMEFGGMETGGAETGYPVGRLRGVVATSDRWPVPGAAVTVLSAGGQQLARTDTDGSGGFDVPIAVSGMVTVVVAAAGVDPQARSAAVGMTGTTDLGVVLLASAHRAELPQPGRWVVDPAHSIVRATARHLALSRVEGRFTDFTAVVRIAEPVEESSVEVTIEAASIHTGNEERDTHLRSADFLDVERFPHLTYRSQSVQLAGPDRWQVTGQLTIRDITRPVPLSVNYLGCGPDPWGGTRMALTASAQLIRRDFEINWNMGVPGGLVVVGPTLRVELDVQAVLEE